MTQISRRTMLKAMGLPAAAAPFLFGLPSVSGATLGPKPRRLIIVFSANGVVGDAMWPDAPGPIEAFKPILEPLEPYRSRVSTLRGVNNKVRGLGDNHMRGISCLLTGNELFPGNIVGGGGTAPAGWARSISIDQQIKNLLQKNEQTRTVFGSLEFGVAVPNRSDTWTRMCYAGPNQPVAPISNPRQMVDKLYGETADKKSLLSVVDGVKDDLKRVSGKLSPEDRELMQRHLELIAQMQTQLELADANDSRHHPVPEVDPHIELVNDNTPQVSRIQIDLLVNSLANNMTRVATLQYMRSVSQARMKWLEVEEGHHSLSHEPDKNQDAQDKLIKINQWFAGEIAYLAKQLADTPEPGGVGGSMLDNTLIVWTNELGKGNNHTHTDIPFVLIGGENLGIKQGQAIDFKPKIAHNRLLMSLARAMGHELESFGINKLCQGGTIELG
ncbi:MAG: DUF1552 domain-containing protein [Phycisphaeraceae bacterium]|nr:DUF1552 domain-containing protein [Phycisphaeraceae bacterium]